MAGDLGVRHHVPVALFTLEMSKSEVTQRMMCSEAKLESQRLRTGRLAPDDWPRLTAACDRLMKAPIYVDDAGSTSIMELRSKARRLKSREPNLGLIIVDYLQLMVSDRNAESRVQEVSQILARTQGARARARGADPRDVAALSRSSSSATTSGRSSPTSADSGSIEQDADLVMFIYRDEYYVGEESDQQGIAEVILAKHRNGPTGMIKLSWLRRYAKFADLAAA